MLIYFPEKILKSIMWPSLKSEVEVNQIGTAIFGINQMWASEYRQRSQSTLYSDLVLSF